jgi:acetyl esterase/lipase
MIHEKINYDPDGRVCLETYINDDRYRQKGADPVKKPAIIIMPGGAYQVHAPNEGEPVALTFLEKGFRTFVLKYSLMEHASFPELLHEACWAVYTVRQNAEKWNIDPDKIAVMGFSAGASLAMILATNWHRPEYSAKIGATPQDVKPNAVVSSYGMMEQPDEVPDFVLKNAPAIVEQNPPEFSPIDFIGPEMPPVFLWHTRIDRLVPPSQALKLAMKLDDQGIPYEAHIFDGGRHSLSVCNELSHTDSLGSMILKDNENVRKWVDMCSSWLKKTFKAKKK